MYFLVGILLLLVLFLSLFHHHRKKKICKRICSMSCDEKLEQITSLIEPFGYTYIPCQDIFSTTIDAPQRAFGYTALYDYYAPRFGMVFDCLPIYFDYSGRTWLIELWKGQYGINLGCEVGIYKADSLVAQSQLRTTLFHSIEDQEMLPISIDLFYQNSPLAHICTRHWWATAFDMGNYAQPYDLSMDVRITFPNMSMLAAYANVLDTSGKCLYRVYGLQVMIHFDYCSSCLLSGIQKWICRITQWKNRHMCHLFIWITKPFTASLDRLLYLYYYLPVSIRLLFRDKKRHKCHKKGKRKCRL